MTRNSRLILDFHVKTSRFHNQKTDVFMDVNASDYEAHLVNLHIFYFTTIPMLTSFVDINVLSNDSIVNTCFII